MYERDKLLDAGNQSKMNQAVVNHQNRPITSNEIEAVIKNLLTKKRSRHDEFMIEFYKISKELIAIFLKLF
jgi:hypothetical protein